MDQANDQPATAEQSKKPPRIPRRRNNASFSNYGLPPPPPRPLYSPPTTTYPYNPYRFMPVLITNAFENIYYPF